MRNKVARNLRRIAKVRASQVGVNPRRLYKRLKGEHTKGTSIIKKGELSKMH